MTLYSEEHAMTDAEKLLGIINTISANRKIGIFDALMVFCEESNIEIEDIIPLLDSNLIEKIRTDALNMNIVCNRKLFEKKTTSLF